MVRRAHAAAKLSSVEEPAHEEYTPVAEEMMPMEPQTPCNVCRHEERAVIDGLLTLGIPLRAIARCYGFSKSSADRHKKNHLPTFPNAEKARQIVDGVNALHVPMIYLRQARYSFDAEVIINRLFDSFMDTLGNNPLDSLRRVMLIALAYLFRTAGSGNTAERDFEEALEVLESWGKTRDAEQFEKAQ
ncbi:MAG: hypothetical protein ABSF77_01725 [Spirochaetia bacterium]|jgi:hypothetical protein